MLKYTPETDPQYGIHPMVQNCLIGYGICHTLEDAAGRSAVGSKCVNRHRRRHVTGKSRNAVRWFEDLNVEDLSRVGGKNASLGEMIRMLKDEGIRVPDGFATTAEAYRDIKWQKKNVTAASSRSRRSYRNTARDRSPPWKNHPMRPKNRR